MMTQFGGDLTHPLFLMQRSSLLGHARLVKTGTAKADFLTGSEQADTLRGYAGNDKLEGLAGDDHLFGGDGDDVLRGGAGADVLNGGNGNDAVSYFRDGNFAKVALDGSFVSEGAAAGDTLIGIEILSGADGFDDYFVGNTANNELYGHGGEDTLYGRAGNDILAGGAGADDLFGEAGRDTVSYESDGAVTMSLDKSVVNTGAAAGDLFDSVENVRGSAIGSDKITGDAQSNYLYGLGGDDVLHGLAGADKLYGGNGSDGLEGGLGADLLDGGDGLDFADYAKTSGVTVDLAMITAGTGEALGDKFISVEGLLGSETGADVLYGDAASNLIIGGGGNDRLFGRAGDDSLRGGAGADKYDGGAGVDTVDFSSEAGVTVSLDGTLVAAGAAAGETFIRVENLVGSATQADTLRGDVNNNLLQGRGGDDKLNGVGGADTILGGSGVDIVTGGAGADNFVFESLSDAGDKVTDFAAEDTLVFAFSVYGKAGERGKFLTDNFIVTNGGHALPATQTKAAFIYDKVEHKLWFDGNGAAAGQDIMVAEFTNGFQPTKGDIFLA